MKTREAKVRENIVENNPFSHIFSSHNEQFTWNTDIYLLEIVLPVAIIALLATVIGFVSKYYRGRIRGHRVKYERRIHLSDPTDFILGFEVQTERLPSVRYDFFDCSLLYFHTSLSWINCVDLFLKSKRLISFLIGFPRNNEEICCWNRCNPKHKPSHRGHRIRHRSTIVSFVFTLNLNHRELNWSEKSIL